MTQARERTFVMIKPDGIHRGLAGKIISRIERKGLKLVALKMMRMDKALAEKHYAVHQGKPFYDRLIDFITSGPVIASIWEGENAVAIVRKLVGATSPDIAEPGSIRGDFVINTTHNTVHASDSKETAAFEINLFFKSEEIQDYALCLEPWLYKNA
jgi:nucleoside-diphosphate kinase